MALNIIKNYLTNNRCYQAGVTCPKIGIQVHSIGTGQGTAESVASYWNQGAVAACVHYCVDADIPGKVLQLLPEERRSWADAGYGNNNLITMEICESDFIRYTGSGAAYVVLDAERFRADIMRGYKTAVELCAKICKERGWNPLAKLPSGLYLISSHNEGRLAGLSSAHVDPDHVWDRFGLSMDGFRKAVKAAMDGGSDVYYVRKAWSDKGSQIGVYASLENAKRACLKGYNVYNAVGKKIYTPVFEVGKRYKMTRDLSIRKEPKASAALLKYSEIPQSRRKYFKKGTDGQALIKKGTKDKCFAEEQVEDRGVYMKITRGWILAQYLGKNRVTKV